MNSPPLRKLLWLVAALAAMVLFAPGVASAHEDHGYRRPDASLAHGGLTAGARSTSAAKAIRSALAQAAGVKIAGVKDVAASRSAAEDSADACSGGCCFGTGCCGVILAATIPGLEPPHAGRLRLQYASLAPPSAGPSSLLEPPNAFA